MGNATTDRPHVAWTEHLGTGQPDADLPAQERSIPVPSTSSPSMLSPEEMRADLAHFLRVLEDVHPDPYHYTSQRTIRRLHEQTLDRLDTPRSTREFYVEVAQLAAAFGDGHTQVRWPRPVFLKSMREGDRVLPFRVERTSSGVRVTRGCKEALNLMGSRVALLEDWRPERLHDVMQGLVSGTPRYRSAQVDAHFPWLAWALGLDTPFRVATTNEPLAEVGSAAAEASVQVDTLRGLTMLGVQSCLAEGRKPPVSFERRDGPRGSTVGVLTVRSLTQPRRVEQGVQNALRSVEAEPVDGIVIDLRDNHGGATQAAVHVLAPLTRQRVKLTRQKSWKISDTYKAYLRRQGLDGSGYLRARSGKTIDIEYDAEALPKARYRFDGPVSVIVGARTFSAAVKLADAAQHYGIATIIGSETGGRPSSFGEGYRFRLPHSNLQAMASTAYFVRLNGQESNRGVIPDVAVPDVTVGTTDLALETAIQRTF
jgi:hypothetical protein